MFGILPYESQSLCQRESRKLLHLLFLDSGLVPLPSGNFYPCIRAEVPGGSDLSWLSTVVTRLLTLGPPWGVRKLL